MVGTGTCTRLSTTNPHILDNEQASTAAGFWAAPAAWYQSIGIPVERVTDNGPCYRSGLWHRACAATATTVNKTRPYRPQTRQDRAIPPDPLRGMGLHSALGLQKPNGPAPTRVRAFLQSPPIPRSTRRATPNQHPQGQPPRDAQLGVMTGTLSLGGWCGGVEPSERDCGLSKTHFSATSPAVPCAVALGTLMSSPAKHPNSPPPKVSKSR